jgi:Ca2+-dependent lipid-binding protein
MSDTHYTGLLRVFVKCANNLKDTDIGGKSDPYAVITFDHTKEGAPKKQKTHVINNNLNPVWNANLFFLVSDECKQFKVELFDEDIGKDDKLGHVHILRKDEDVRFQYTGDTYYLENGGGGTVEIWTQEINVSSGLGQRLSDKFNDINAYLAAKNRENFALLEVYLHGAEGLKSGLIDKSDPYAKLDFSQDPQKDQFHPHKLRTKTIDNNPSPVWEEVFHFLVPWDIKTFKIEIFDEDVGKDDSLGHVNVAVGKVGTMKNRDKLAVSKKGNLQLSYAVLPMKPLFDDIE